MFFETADVLLEALALLLEARDSFFGSWRYAPSSFMRSSWRMRSRPA